MLIDWDLAAPGSRVHDLAHVCWRFTDRNLSADPAVITGRIGAILNGYRWDGTFEEVVESMLWWQDRCWRGIQAGAEAGIAGDQLLRDDGVVAGIQDQYEGTKRHLLAR